MLKYQRSHKSNFLLSFSEHMIIQSNVFVSTGKDNLMVSVCNAIISQIIKLPVFQTPISKTQEYSACFQPQGLCLMIKGALDTMGSLAKWPSMYVFVKDAQEILIHSYLYLTQVRPLLQDSSLINSKRLLLLG